MDNKNLTALISAFARAYHYNNHEYRIINDKESINIFKPNEYEEIGESLASGISFFNPSYEGNNPLKWIMENRISPIVLARTAFNEHVLANDIKIGLEQYLVLASGYDTSIYSNKKILSNIKCFEVDKESMILDKKERLLKNNIDNNTIFISYDLCHNDLDTALVNNNFDKNKKTLCTLLGISYYLKKEEFRKLINTISNILPAGSSIIFDYPTFEKNESIKQIEELAFVARETMQDKYSYKDIVDILEDSNFLIYEHLNHFEADRDYFLKYNTLNPDSKILSPNGVNYCLAVKK